MLRPPPKGSGFPQPYVFMDEIIKSFRKVYPEENIEIVKTEGLWPNRYLITADFPDGRFYFLVTPNSVSSAFDSREKAMTKGLN